MAKNNKNTKIQCEECDSEFNIKYIQTSVSGEIKYCSFCGNEFEEVDEPEIEEETSSDYDW